MEIIDRWQRRCAMGFGFTATQSSIASHSIAFHTSLPLRWTRRTPS
jgi:hypothetical protein